MAALTKILGSGGEDLVASEDAVQDKNIAIAFAEEARRKNSIAIDPKKPDRAILVVGNRNWPMAIPIVKRNGKWLFDTKAGRKRCSTGASARTNSTPCRFAETTCMPSTNTHCQNMMIPK